MKVNKRQTISLETHIFKKYFTIVKVVSCEL